LHYFGGSTEIARQHLMMGMPWVIVEQYGLLIPQKKSDVARVIAGMGSCNFNLPLAASFRDPFVACLDLNDLFF
jgi:hypothetical protein